MIVDNKDNDTTPLGISRRWIIKLGLLTAASCLIPYKALASVADFFSNERALCLHNMHTEDKIEAVYWQNGNYIPEVLNKINIDRKSVV